jgi:hypothetical protein
VEIKDVSLPQSMKRSMSRQAEADRERRARIITADGEYQASKRLAMAANVMARDPAALQLRLLQTVVRWPGRRTARWSDSSWPMGSVSCGASDQSPCAAVMISGSCPIQFRPAAPRRRLARSASAAGN